MEHNVNIDIRPVKSRFNGDEPLSFILRSVGGSSGGGHSFAGTLELCLYRGGPDPTYVEERRIELSPGGTVRWETEFCAGTDRWQGFRAIVNVRGRDGMRSIAATACDTAGLSTTGERPVGDENTPEESPAGFNREQASPRYGFLTGFSSEDTDQDDLDWLTACHISHVQFYDWMYRHDRLLPPERRYVDPLGRNLDIETVKEKVAGCRERGMHPIAYGAVYGASREYADAHPEERLFQRDGTPYSLVDWLAIMNVSRNSSWTTHIVEEFSRVCDAIGFEGIHMDTYGFPKRGYDENGAVVSLDEEFPSLISRTRAAIEERCGRGATLFFNAVNNWPVPALSQCDLDATYVEVWPPNTRYRDLWRISREARLQSRRTPVLAAYLTPFDPEETESEENPAGDPTAEAIASLLYATAVITTSGATHLVLGEAGCVLSHPYYVRHGSLSERGRALITRYYDMLTAYGSLLSASDSEEITLDHAHGPDDEVLFEIPSPGPGISAFPDAGAVWAAVRETPEYYVVSLVNLTELSNDEWNRPKPLPTGPIREIQITLVSTEPIAEAGSDSPDRGDAEDPFGERRNPTPPEKLDLEEIATHKGPACRVTVPPVWLWRLVWFRKSPEAPTRSRRNSDK